MRPGLKARQPSEKRDGPEDSPVEPRKATSPKETSDQGTRERKTRAKIRKDASTRRSAQYNQQRRPGLKARQPSGKRDMPKYSPVQPQKATRSKETLYHGNRERKTRRKKQKRCKHAKPSPVQPTKATRTESVTTIRKTRYVQE